MSLAGARLPVCENGCVESRHDLVHQLGDGCLCARIIPQTEVSTYRRPAEGQSYTWRLFAGLPYTSDCSTAGSNTESNVNVRSFPCAANARGPGASAMRSPVRAQHCRWRTYDDNLSSGREAHALR